MTCGSVWACPVCAATVAARRAEERARVLGAVHESGGSPFMLTLTIRASAGDRLGLSTDERHRRGLRDPRRNWRQRLDAIADRRDQREIAEAKGGDVDEHATGADDITEASTRREITEPGGCAPTTSTPNCSTPPRPARHWLACRELSWHDNPRPRERALPRLTSSRSVSHSLSETGCV